MPQLFEKSRATESADDRQLSAPTGLTWLLAGAVLVFAYVVQASIGWEWTWLAALQEIELYKQITGLALALLFLMQWRLTAARMQGNLRLAVPRLSAHKYWGAVAPLLLLAHADSFGHAYIRVLCMAFLSLVTLGLLHQIVARVNQPWLTNSWMVVHVSLAAMLIFLIGYHGFNSFYYE